MPVWCEKCVQEVFFNLYPCIQTAFRVEKRNWEHEWSVWHDSFNQCKSHENILNQWKQNLCSLFKCPPDRMNAAPLHLCCLLLNHPVLVSVCCPDVRGGISLSGQTHCVLVSVLKEGLSYAFWSHSFQCVIMYYSLCWFFPPSAAFTSYVSDSSHWCLCMHSTQNFIDSDSFSSRFV